MMSDIINKRYLQRDIIIIKDFLILYIADNIYKDIKFNLNSKTVYKVFILIKII